MMVRSRSGVDLWSKLVGDLFTYIFAHILDLQFERWRSRFLDGARDLSSIPILLGEKDIQYYIVNILDIW